MLTRMSATYYLLTMATLTTYQDVGDLLLTMATLTTYQDVGDRLDELRGVG